MQFDHRSILEQSRSDNEIDVSTDKAPKHMRAMKRWSYRATGWWIWELCAMECHLTSLDAIVLTE